MSFECILSVGCWVPSSRWRGGGARDGGRVGRRGVLVMDCVRRAPMDDRHGLLVARVMDAVRRGRNAASARGQGYLMGWAEGGGAGGGG